MKVKIRKAKLSDAKQCIDIVRLDGDKHWTEGGFKASSKDTYAIFVVAEENKKILGYTIGFVVPTESTEALLHETRVLKNQRGKNIGTRLVDDFCREAFRRNVKTICVLIDDKHAKFYCGACGFKKDKKWLEVIKKKGK